MAGLLILSIETATGCGSVAVTRGGTGNGRLLAEATAQPEITHSRRLLGSVDWVMRAASVHWSDLAGVAISLGPGSFTGLRIGMAAAKGIALAADLPLIGVPALDGVALSCPVIDRPLWCLFDARKQEVYASCYHPGPDGRPQLYSKVVAITPERLCESIHHPVILAGPGVDVYHDLFSGIEDVQLVSSALSSPGAGRVGFLAADRLMDGQILDPAVAVPLYVRASEAEINAQNIKKAAHLGKQ